MPPASKKQGYGPGPRAYPGGYFEMLLDGHKSASFLKSVDGGFATQQVIDNSGGSSTYHQKYGGPLDVEPMTIDFGLAGAFEILKWIQGSWRGDWSTRNGEIVHADFNLKQTFSHQFSDAMITETTFPALDGGSNEGAYAKVKIQPQTVVTEQKPGAQLRPNEGIKQKQWLSSSFRLNLEGISQLDKVNKIESFTIKQGVKKFWIGQDRFPTLHPTGITFPNLICTIGEAYAKDLWKWMDEVKKGKPEAQQTTGSLEFLNGAKQTIFRLNLYEVGLKICSIVQSTANEAKIKRVKFELFIGKMDIDGKGLGLE
jgi:hypothetical protein